MLFTLHQRAREHLTVEQGLYILAMLTGEYGVAPFSAPETAALRDFANSRVVGGVQQIKANIDFHTYDQLVLWPYGYTYTDVPSDMTQDDHDVFAAWATPWRAATATPRSRSATCTLRTARSTTGSTASTGSSPTPSRCTRPPRARAASIRPTR